MAQRAAFHDIAPYLIRVLHTLLIERSDFRAAPAMAGMQPAVGAPLGQRCALTGQPLLVRACNPSQPTEAAMQMPGPGTQA